MSQGVLCLILAVIFPIVFAGLAKWGGMRHGVSYDNGAPRESLARLSGWPQRAQWAQQNSWEALPVFAIGMLLAMHAQAPAATLAFWGWLFIAARVAYGVCYLAGFAGLRSLSWLLGFAISIRLMLLAL